MPTLDRIAKTIVGPNEAHNIGPTKLQELQDLKWGRLKSQEQSHFLRAAKFIRELFDNEPDGFVILNGDGTKARMIDAPEFEGDSFMQAVWTDDLDKAMWFARRHDAEQFAADDEDAWSIRRVSDLRSTWAPRSAPIPPPVPGNAVPIEGQQGEGANVTAPTTPPHPAALPADDRRCEHLLFALRGFINRNVAQWVMGAGDHHHPIWADVAAELHQYDLNYYPTSGPEYIYIQPENRKSFTVIQSEFIEKGGEVANS